MPEKIFALYNYVDAERERAQRMFLDAGLLDVVVDPEMFAGFQKIPLPDETTALKLSMLAPMHGLRAPSIHRELHPTERELRGCRLLHMFVWTHASPEGHPRETTTYDESHACPECGAGLRQTSPLVLRRPEVPKRGLLGSIGDDVLVHESLARELQDAGFAGLRFEPVLDHTHAPLPWRQLVVEGSMPPMTAASRGLKRGKFAGEEPCPRCARDGYFDSAADPFLPAYASSALVGLPDIALTSEHFGTGAWARPIHGRRHLASRRIIVRPGVYAFFRARKVRGVRFSPVAVS